MTPFRVAFLGAGGIAQAHAYALDALKYYYSDAPKIKRVFVASPTPTSRKNFAERYNFSESLHPDAVWERDDFDTLYILGPNYTHTPQLIQAVKQPHIQRVYVEKPLGASPQDLQVISSFEKQDHGKFIMMGFQFLQKSAIRKALAHWKTGEFGEPIHFRSEYLHSSYLDPDYRQKRQDRLQPIPANGAVVDLGSHILSLLTAFLGDALVVRSAATSGKFADVPENTDLCTTVLLEDPHSGAVGTLVASRVSNGAGDFLTLEIHGTRGTLRFGTTQPDVYQTFLPNEGWREHKVMSDYLPASKFSADYVPSGWLRALVHAHYLFLGGEDPLSLIPDLRHGIRVQQMLQQIAEQILPN